MNENIVMLINGLLGKWEMGEMQNMDIKNKKTKQKMHASVYATARRRRLRFGELNQPHTLRSIED